MAFQLASSNIARMLGDIDTPVMAGFVARLEPLNEIADASKGFIWRYETEAGDATEVRVFEDELILFNMSVWESIEALEAFAYRSDHLEALQKRAQWFERPTRTPLVLWWIPAGHIPTVQEARDRFDLLWRDGASPDAFTFRDRFPVPQQ